MQIPASRLIDKLIPGQPVEVRTSDYRGYDAAMPYTEAIALVIRGSVEGIASPSGRVRYLRLLGPAELAGANGSRKSGGISADSPSGSSSDVIAHCNLGVYRERVRECRVDRSLYGTPVVVASGDIVGTIYAHCALRGADL